MYIWHIDGRLSPIEYGCEDDANQAPRLNLDGAFVLRRKECGSYYHLIKQAMNSHTTWVQFQIGERFLDSTYGIILGFNRLVSDIGSIAMVDGPQPELLRRYN